MSLTRLQILQQQTYNGGCYCEVINQIIGVIAHE